MKFPTEWKVINFMFQRIPNNQPVIVLYNRNSMNFHRFTGAKPGFHSLPRCTTGFSPRLAGTSGSGTTKNTFHNHIVIFFKNIIICIYIILYRYICATVKTWYWFHGHQFRGYRSSRLPIASHSGSSLLAKKKMDYINISICICISIYSRISRLSISIYIYIDRIYTYMGVVQIRWACQQ